MSPELAVLRARLFHHTGQVQPLFMHHCDVQFTSRLLRKFLLSCLNAACCAVLCCAVLCCAVPCCATSSSVCFHAPLCAHAAGDWQAHQDARLHCDGLLANLRSTVPQGNGTGQPLMLALRCLFCSPASPLELLLLCGHHCNHTALAVRACARRC